MGGLKKTGEVYISGNGYGGALGTMVGVGCIGVISDQGYGGALGIVANCGALGIELSLADRGMVVDRGALVTAVVVDIGPLSISPTVVDLCTLPIVIGINTLRFLNFRSLNTSVTTTRYETFKISQLVEETTPLGITRRPTLEPGS